MEPGRRTCNGFAAPGKGAPGEATMAATSDAVWMLDSKCDTLRHAGDHADFINPSSRTRIKSVGIGNETATVGRRKSFPSIASGD